MMEKKKWMIKMEGILWLALHTESFLMQKSKQTGNTLSLLTSNAKMSCNRAGFFLPPNLLRVRHIFYYLFKNQVRLCAPTHK